MLEHFWFTLSHRDDDLFPSPTWIAMKYEEGYWQVSPNGLEHDSVEFTDAEVESLRASGEWELIEEIEYER